MMTVPLPQDRPTLTVWPEAGRILGLGRAATYAAAARGEIPTLRFGSRLVVPTAALRLMLGLEICEGEVPTSPVAAIHTLTSAANSSAGDRPRVPR